MGSFFRLKPFIRENKLYYILGILALVGTNILQLFIPRLLGQLTDGIAEYQVGYLDLIRYMALIVGISVLIAVCRFLWRIFVMGNARKLEYTIRNMLFRHLQSLSSRFFDTHKTGDLMAHATNDVRALRMALGPGVVMTTDALFLSSIIIFMMVRTIDWRLTVFALLPLPFMVAVVTMAGRIIHKRFRIVQEAFSNLSDRTQENISGMRVVKGFAQEEPEIERFREVNQENVDKNMHLVRAWGLFMPLVQFLSALAFIIAMGYGGISVIEGRITIGDFVAFNSYLAMLTWPMIAIGFVMNVVQRGKASMDRLNDLFDERPEVYNEEDALPVEKIQGDIEFSNLTFHYPGSKTPALEDVSFSVPAGSTLGILGRTGAGKTTLVNLLLRMHNPPRGTVFVDGVDVRKLPLETLRRHIGYVPQDNFLFSTTIRDNIDFGDTGKSPEEIEYAAKLAQVYDNIIAFPKKFDTLVGERGVTLSGGQKQRLSIARALVKDPSILILDDSLSAVDTETEEAILRNLQSIMENRTTILIAHRISTLKQADQTVVIDDGRVLQQGTHDRLITEPGLYRELYEKQLLEEEIDSVS